MTSGSAKTPPGPMAALIPCSNSHPFEERRIIVPRSEEQAVKIGRAVARLMPATNNAIFDCKVLSRNHALLWYEDEQFLIKDSRSSNGTFINNQRLSNSGEESVPKPLHSGDILQLGVEIVDNVKKVSSGCITCIVRLINEKGEECVNPRNNSTMQKPLPAVENDRLPSDHTLISNDKLFMMTQYMKEAMFRESLLTQKLRSLESLLEMAEEASETSWQALINEERLLSRIEILESQLAIYVNKNTGNDDLRKEIQDVYEDRTKAELMAKDHLRKAEEQVYETTMHLHDVEKSLVNIEEENSFLRKQCDNYEQELRRRKDELEDLHNKYTEALREAQERSVVNRSDAQTSTSSDEKPDPFNTAFYTGLNGVRGASGSDSSYSASTAQSISTESGMEFIVSTVAGNVPSKKSPISSKSNERLPEFRDELLEEKPSAPALVNGTSDHEEETGSTVREQGVPFDAYSESFASQASEAIMTQTPPQDEVLSDERLKTISSDSAESVERANARVAETSASSPIVDSDSQLRRRSIPNAVVNEDDAHSMLCTTCALRRKSAESTSSSTNVQLLFLSVFPLIALLLLILRPFTRLVPSCSWSSLYACGSSSSEQQTTTDTLPQQDSEQTGGETSTDE
ncbi:FHA domain-containing protein [Aphelenchoides avenae]|nr:FHA domain-containing protein [Aphelenchus avenae]